MALTGPTPVSAPDAHLRRLAASWGLLADLGFADLLMLVPAGSAWKVVAQVRPTTGQTLYPDDLVGALVHTSDRPMLSDVWRTGESVEANVHAIGSGQAARSRAFPVRAYGSGDILAVVCKEESLETGRRRGQLERTYLGLFDQLASMVMHGQYPFAEEHDPREVPRVGDGVAVLDADRRLRYVSPNATSALHRLGVRVNIDGRRLNEIGLDESDVHRVWSKKHPVGGELTRTDTSDRGTRVGLGGAGLGVAQSGSRLNLPDEEDGTVIAIHCIPLLLPPAESGGQVDGAVVLLRDVSDLRRRDRLLVSKDATIREVHHRVKNNLQTISALLRLQGRRLESAEAKQAIEESVRRIRSIALVHETLSQEREEAVPFDELIRPLTRVVEEGLQGDERPVRFAIVGEAGLLSAEVATPLAVVLVELLQNAVEHAYPGKSGGTVEVQFVRKPSSLHVTVRDQGVGFPQSFALSTTRSLGLSIVRTLVASELGGVIATRNEQGAVVELRLPL